MRRFWRSLLVIALVVSVFAAIGVTPVGATTDCTFTTSGSTLRLDASCTTDETLFIPDGMTLDGGGHTITAVDPPGGHFVGAIVQNAGTTAHVKNLTVQAGSLANVCDGGDDRLRGIMFEGASGSITRNTVRDINQGPSGCQEGNAIEVRNAPFDGTHPNTLSVDIEHNVVEDYQKTGIVANGDVRVEIHHNRVGESATQDNLAANSIQVAFGATGNVTKNKVDGNQWKGTSDFASAAILIIDAGDGLNVSQNNIRGNSDVGLYIFANNGTYNNNRVFDEGADHPNSGYDIGVGNWGTGNSVTNNKSKGFTTPYSGDIDDSNKAIGKPSS